MNLLEQEQTGAVEACWAHNPEVRGSKPRSAKRNILLAALVDSLSWTEQEGKKTIERVDISSYDSFMNNKPHANSSSNNVTTLVCSMSFPNDQ